MKFFGVTLSDNTFEAMIFFLVKFDTRILALFVFRMVRFNMFLYLAANFLVHTLNFFLLKGYFRPNTPFVKISRSDKKPSNILRNVNAFQIVLAII